MKYKVITNKTATWLTYLGEKRMKFFTTEDAMQFFNGSQKQRVTEFLNDMVERELAIRIKRGLYALVPFDQRAGEYYPDLHATGAHLAGNSGYYIGYYSALQIHSLTTQPSDTERVVINKRIIPSIQEFHNNQFQFIYHKPHHFFGTTKRWVDDDNRIICSDLEKTIIDCLFQPQYAGGIVEIAKSIHQVSNKLNYKILLEYIKKFKSQAVIKRFGFLVELFELDVPIITQLQEIKTISYVALDPTHEKAGKMNSRWSVYINVDLETIKQAPFT